MANHSSAITHTESPHSTIRALKRRAKSIINNKSIYPGTRAIIHYGLEITDASLPDLIPRAEAHELLLDNLTPPTPQTTQHNSPEPDSLRDHSVEYDSVDDPPDENDSIEYHLDKNDSVADHSSDRDTPEDASTAAKLEALTELICRLGDDPGTKSAALLVLMATLENSPHPQALANLAKHLAFTRCCELNLYGLLDIQIAAVEHELLADNIRYPDHFQKSKHHPHTRQI